MLIEELDILTETNMVWRKVGGSIVRAVRCSSGRRKGRVVGNAGQCSAPVDVKKRITLNKTRARLGKKMSAKARRTKRVNPVSKRVAKMNKKGRK
jgi:hypothetical protein